MKLSLGMLVLMGVAACVAFANDAPVKGKPFVMSQEERAAINMMFEKQNETIREQDRLLLQQQHELDLLRGATGCS